MKYPEESFPNSMLPDICLSLRMALNGAGDPWSDQKLDEVFEALQHRLDTWRFSGSSMMDECVRLLIIATLAECKGLRERLWSKVVISQAKHWDGKVVDDHAGYGLCLDPGTGRSVDLVHAEIMLGGLEGCSVHITVEPKTGD